MDYRTMGGHHWQNARDEDGKLVSNVFKIQNKNYRTKLPDIDRVVLPSMRSHVGTALNQKPQIKYGVNHGPMAFFDESFEPEQQVITLKNPWKHNPAFTDFSDATFGFSNIKGVHGVAESQTLKERRELTEIEFMNRELERRQVAINERRDYMDKRRTPNLLSRGGRV
jgi:hypothetical protein